MSISSGGLGAPHIEIYSVPGGGGGGEEGVVNAKGHLLSSFLCSYELWPHPDHVHSKVVDTDKKFFMHFSKGEGPEERGKR